MYKSRVIALIIASMVATASFAGAQATVSSSAAPRARQVREGHAGHERLLRGVQLNATEKSRIKEIRAQYKTQVQPLHASLAPARAQARADRQKGDTAAARAVMERTKGDRETLRTLKQREQADVRAALTPEHQRQFDASRKQAGHRGGALNGRRKGKVRKASA
ncbi:MAG: Spy/CpxP family protein refolding chaperone [bacterium]